jgi:hypothetical protein
MSRLSNFGTNGIWNYESITNQPSDRLTKNIDKFDADTKQYIKLINKLPVDIAVVQETIGKNINIESAPIYRGVLKSKSVLEINYNELTDGDLLHFIDPNSKDIKFICRSYDVTKRHGDILVGNVASYTETYKRDISAGGDISSINIHNLLGWPVVITTGRTGGSIAGNNDIYNIINVQANINLQNPRYHGDLTMSPSSYFDNLNQGINIGTTFEVYASINNMSHHLYSFTINDNNEDRIFIGITSAIIDQSELTGISGSYMLAPQNTTGRAIYRLGSSERDLSKPNFLPGQLPNYAFDAKNSNNTDKLRNTINNNSKNRSTVPLARYKDLSGRNVISGFYL